MSTKSDNLRNWITAIDTINETREFIKKTIKDVLPDAIINFNNHWDYEDNKYFLINNFDFELILNNQTQKYTFDQFSDNHIFLAPETWIITKLNDTKLADYLAFCQNIKQKVKALDLQRLNQSTKILNNSNTVLVAPYIDVYNNHIAFRKADTNNHNDICVLDVQNKHLYYKNNYGEEIDLDLNIFNTTTQLNLYDIQFAAYFDFQYIKNPPWGKIVGVGFDVREFTKNNITSSNVFNLSNINVYLAYNQGLLYLITHGNDEEESFYHSTADINKPIFANWAQVDGTNNYKMFANLDLNEFYLQFNYMKKVFNVYKQWEQTDFESTETYEQLLALLNTDYKIADTSIKDTSTTPTITHSNHYFVLDLPNKAILTKPIKTKL